MANKLKSIWAEGRATTNGWLSIPHVVTAEVMAGLGWDSITIDMHHGLIDYPAMLSMLVALGDSGPVPLVRVPWNDPGTIYRVLDAGAKGVICPMINTAAEAEIFVKATKYPPLGSRSFGPIRPLIKEGPHYVATANATCLALAQIETRQALANIDAIFSVPGLDGVYVGPSDLAFDMGLPPHFDTEVPALLQTFEVILAAAKRHGLAAGMHNSTPAYAKRMAEAGFDLVTFGSDIGFMLAAGQASMATYNGHGGTGTRGAY